MLVMNADNGVGRDITRYIGHILEGSAHLRHLNGIVTAGRYIGVEGRC